MTKALITIGIVGTVVNKGTRLVHVALVGMLNTAAGVVLAQVIAVVFPPFVPLLWTAAATEDRPPRRLTDRRASAVSLPADL